MKSLNMKNKKNFEQKYVLHDMEKASYCVKFNITFLEGLDKYKEFLRLLYISTIGNVLLPEPAIKNINSMSQDLFKLLDWAWLCLYEYNETRIPEGHSPGVSPELPSFSDYTVDEYYPNLQQSGWIKDRRERYGGIINHLNQQEIYSELIFFKNLFDSKSITEWKRQIEKWILFAIDKDNNIVDSGISTAYETFQDYVNLQKLLESCWISIEQDHNLNYQDLCPWFNKNNYPVFSVLGFAFNPYDELFGLFHAHSLIQQKKKINTWFAAVLQTEKIWEGMASDLVKFHKEIGLMIECCWVIKELGPNYPKEWNTYNTYYSRKRAPEAGEKHPFKLKELKNKPENYLLQFFKDNDLNSCRNLLYECLYTALGDIEYYPYDEKEIKEFQVDLIKLVEAAYLIQKSKYNGRVYLYD